MKKQEKTNVMRILDQKNIIQNVHDYSDTEMVRGLEVSSVVNQYPNVLFKKICYI